MLVSPSEEKMWEVVQPREKVELSDAEISRKYELREKRIVTETSHERLRNFYEALKRPGYIEVRPYYQRRIRWDAARQSKLIESFIMNIPVPPVILYERSYSSYEVMDGQQRITAIEDFYDNKFKLAKLELWPELNGRKYNELPFTIKAGIDRRSISSIVILNESAPDEEEALALKQQAFERLNTMGVELTAQEVRNCVYQGKFNKLLDELSKYPLFTTAWGIPREGNTDARGNYNTLTKNTLYKKMEDIELVLRFFALRHAQHFRNGLKGFLDLYMQKSLRFSDQDIEILRKLFLDSINLAYQLYGDKLFRPFNLEQGAWESKPHRAFYEAVMVGISKHLNNAEKLTLRKSRVVELTKEICINDELGLLRGTGKANKTSIEEQLGMLDEMFSMVVRED